MNANNLNETDDDLLNRYNYKFNEFMRITFDRQYMFEVKKCCCNYTEFVSIEKDATLSELYDKLRRTFVGTVVENIYMLNKNGDVVNLNNSSERTVREIIASRPGYAPIYPLPANIVYKLTVGEFDDMCTCHG